MEHIINLETQYNKLHSKHKKLKKRYNELEGYLYADDEAPIRDKEEAPKPQQQQQQEPPAQEPQQEQETQQEPQQPPVPQPQVQRRYVRSWRQLGQQQ